MEHRWGERFDVDMEVRLATRPFATRAARLVDLSLSGACILAPLELRSLTRVQVALLLPQRLTRATPLISAYVVRVGADRIGVEWCEFAPQAVVELLRSAGARRRQPHRAHGPRSAHDAQALPPTAMSVRSR
jgi:hypothetical protein